MAVSRIGTPAIPADIAAKGSRRGPAGFEQAIRQAAEGFHEARPSSPQAAQQLEAIKTIAQMELMSLNGLLIGALGGRGASPKTSSGASSTMSILMQVLSLLPQKKSEPPAQQVRQSSDAAEPEASNKPLDPADYHQVIERAAETAGLDPDLVRAVVKTESNFNAQAVSTAGAMGLMQLMPGTARDLGVKDPFDPVENVFGGAKYLGDMLKRYAGDLNKALAAYNWGPGNLDRNLASGSGFMPEETRNYISRVNHYYDQFGRRG